MEQSEIDIAIGNKEPHLYFSQILEQSRGGPKRYGNITNSDALSANLQMHCRPQGMEEMTVDDYPQFLVERRRLMANKVRRYFEALRKQLSKPTLRSRSRVRWSK